MRFGLFPLLGSLAVLAGCGEAEQRGAPGSEPSAAAASPAVPPVPPGPAATVSATAREVEEENALYSFAYSYPAQAAAIPALAAMLDGELAQARGEVAAQARAARDEARKEGYPFNPHSSQTAWEVVADLPGWLSLSASTGGYAGGAHGNSGFAALLWDKAAGQRRAATDLFVSKRALTDAIVDPFCDQLDGQRAKKRGEPVNRKSGDMFDACIDPVESTVILGSSNRRSFDRIGILVAPYEAGPYVEGDYEVTVPVTPAVIAAVRPEYRAAFSVRR
jgi:hypothetical protein